MSFLIWSAFWRMRSGSNSELAESDGELLQKKTGILRPLADRVWKQVLALPSWSFRRKAPSRL